MSLIEPGHLFSQHSLRTYQRCPRRFLLRYIDRQPWPAPERDDAAAYRAHLEAGRVFHEWVARALLGIPDAGHDVALHPDLGAWWEAWRAFDLQELPAAVREVELPLVVPLGAYRLYARFDLLALSAQGEAIIVDWKTLATVPRVETMRRALQTRVYQYALVCAGSVVTGGPPLAPEGVSMVYWFANGPSQIALGYSRALHRENHALLLGLAETIANSTREQMARTEDVRECAGCAYRTLCQRETVAEQAQGQGWLAEDLDFSLDEVPEVEF